MNNIALTSSLSSSVPAVVIHFLIFHLFGASVRCRRNYVYVVVHKTCHFTLGDNSVILISRLIQIMLALGLNKKIYTTLEHHFSQLVVVIDHNTECLLNYF